MLDIVALVSLVLSVLSWALFVLITFWKDLPELTQVLRHALNPPPAPAGMGAVVPHAAIDPSKVAAATGTLAGAFKKAGPAPTAAAMSVIFLLIAAIAAGVGKI
jgi:hypothetical protein